MGGPGSGRKPTGRRIEHPVNPRVRSTKVSEKRWKTNVKDSKGNIKLNIQTLSKKGARSFANTFRKTRRGK